VVGVAERVRVEVPELPGLSTTDTGTTVTEGPEGVAAPLRVTVPLNPFTLVSVIEALLEEPPGKMIVVWLEENVKSTTRIVSVVERTREPVVPVTVTV
jgi:hypothetical protein